MAELTTEYLDKKLSEQTAHFDQKIDEQTEALARMVNTGFEAVEGRFTEVITMLDMREQIEQHGREIQEIKRALKLA